MKGILLLSHGDMAKGMLQSSSIFFGENLPQVQALGYQMTDDSEALRKGLVRRSRNWTAATACWC